jgi:hypothetical protein
MRSHGLIKKLIVFDHYLMNINGWIYKDFDQYDTSNLFPHKIHFKHSNSIQYIYLKKRLGESKCVMA